MKSRIPVYRILVLATLPLQSILLEYESEDITPKQVPCGGTYKSERQEYRELDDMELLVRL